MNPAATPSFRHFESLHRCPVCGEGQLVSLFPPDVSRCGECAVVLRQTRPTQEDVRVSHEQGLAYQRHRTEPELERDWERHRRNMKRVGKVMGPQQEAGRALLDIGTGRGDFLTLAQQAGWLVTGTELSPLVAEKARANTGLEVLGGALKEIPFAGRTFDAITLWDVLDYLPNPGEALRFIKHLLRPRGVLFLTVANADEALLKHRLKPHGATPLGDLEPGDDSARLTHFQSKTLRQALIRNGYLIKDFAGEGKSTLTDWWAAPLKAALHPLGIDLSPTLYAVAEVDKSPVKKAIDFE